VSDRRASADERAGEGQGQERLSKA